MKKSLSELELEAFLRPVGGETDDDDDRPPPPPPTMEDLLIPAAASQKPRGDPFANVCGDLGFAFGDRVSSPVSRLDKNAPSLFI